MSRGRFMNRPYGENIMMKKTIKIFRILTCVLVAIYTVLVSYHIGEHARWTFFRISYVDSAYSLAFDSITAATWHYIIPGIIIIALFATTVVFLFRKGWIASIVAAVTTLTGAIYSLCVNTQLSEVGLWREPMRHLGIYDIKLWLAIKPSLARLCILSALCYAALCTVEYIRSRKKLGEENEQDS